MGSGAERREVVIIGSGPAGSATALRLAELDPALAAETVMLEKATHPRPKTCAGGLIPKAVRELQALGVDLTVPNVRVDAARVWTPHGEVDLAGADLCRVVRRAEFDASLARAARVRGVELREGVRVRDLRRDGERIHVVTDAGALSASVVVGADGSGSLVRRRLVAGDDGTVARAVMTDVPLDPGAWNGHASRRYEFDFRPCASGLRGYGWAFPCLIDGRPHANVGAYGLPPVAAGQLHAVMRTQIRRVGGSVGLRWHAFPIRTYGRRQQVAAFRTLLVGDAAGVDALLGEGISFALEYGGLAAEAIVEARRMGAWDFTTYERRVADGPLGRKLRLLATAARLFYGRTGRWWFRLAHASRRGQRLALDWYNGAPELEGLGRWGLLARLGGATVGARG